MAKPNRNQQAAAPVEARKARIFASKMFLTTLRNFSRDPQVIAALQAFIAHKRANPLQPFGSKDYPFKGGLKAYSHSGLTFDAQVVYTISGRDPHIIRLYGVFTHDQLGTGNPAQMKRQQKAAQTFDNTTEFTPYERVDEAQQEINLSLLEDFLLLSK